MLEVGSVVAGKLRIEQMLGRGGMGVVAIATHLQLDQRVALKVLHDELANDPTVIQRFLREAKASAQLRSEHVCRVSDVGQLESGAPYIVMELLEGQDLSHAITQGSLPIATAADYVLQACVAIAEAHALGIVHRDLKPGNLFVTQRLDGSVLIKVLDFGIAKAPTSTDFKMTSTQMVMGSPGYMSPEQLRSAKDVDARSDIWALGVILYECVSGRLPFSGNTITELAVKVAVDPPEPLSGVDPRFNAIVMRCLEKSLDRRYQNVGELANDLVQLAGPQLQATATLITRLLQLKPAASMALPATSAVYDAGVAPTMQTSGVAPPPRAEPTPPPIVIVAPPSTTLQGAIDAAAAAQPKKGKAGMVVVIIMVAAAASIAGIVLLKNHGEDAAPTTVAMGGGKLAQKSDDRPATKVSQPADKGDQGSDNAAGSDTPIDAMAVAANEVDAAVLTNATQPRLDAGAVITANTGSPKLDAGLAHVDAGAHVVTHTPDAAITDPGTELVAAENSYYAGKFAEALVEAERAIHLGMDNPRPAHLVAAKAACQLGEADAAHRHAKQLMESGRQTVGTICQQHGIELEHRNLEDLGSRHRRRQGD